MQTQNDIDKYRYSQILSITSLFSKPIFCYNLDNLNVIQIGNKIGSESTRRYYPRDLIDKTEMIIKEIPDSFRDDHDFYNNIFDTIVSNSLSVWNNLFFTWNSNIALLVN